MAFFLIIIASVINQAESILIKRYNKKYFHGGFVFTAIVSFFSMLFFLVTDLVTDKNGLNFSREILIYGVIAGIFFAAASVLTFIALGCGSYVLSRLILSYGVLIAIVQGMFFGEKPSVFCWIGIALVLVSIYLFKGKDEIDSVKITKKWVITIVLSVLLAGAFGIIQRSQQREFSHMYDNEFMIAALAVSSILLMVVGVITDGKYLVAIMKNGGLYACGAGLSNGATNFLNLLAYSIAPISLVAPLNSGAGMIVAFLVAKIFFKEKFTVLQYTGVALGAVALVLFNF